MFPYNFCQLFVYGELYYKLRDIWTHYSMLYNEIYVNKGTTFWLLCYLDCLREIQKSISIRRSYLLHYVSIHLIKVTGSVLRCSAHIFQNFYISQQEAFFMGCMV